MHRHSVGSAFDWSIPDDELEAQRIQLERGLQNSDISFRLAATIDDDGPPHRHRQQRTYGHRADRQGDSSLEYPRHISEPSIPDFPSFAQRSVHRFGDEEHSHSRGWSYRTADDEDGISPYGGETVSTAAHHASALTLSAGLGGGRAARRDISVSGAEFDPERPLHEMIAGVTSKHSMFDRTKTSNLGVTFDPLVVDSTAELDKILETGHASPRAGVGPPSPISSATTSDSGHPLSPMPRPKLADHLRHVSFSPKRPRKAVSTTNPSTSPLNRPRRQLPEAGHNESMYMTTNAPTPKATRQPEVRLQPATPSQTSSKFTRMARGINKEIEGAQQQLQRQSAAAAVSNRPASAPVEHNPFHDPAEQPRASGLRRPSAMKDPNTSANTTKGKVHLPDVTGLTAAVASPARAGTQYYKYSPNGRPRESEARLIQMLSAVQGQLHELEEENSISRRRVRELELELEKCKREVARERTRLFERKEMSLQSQSRGGKLNGKGKSKDNELEDVQLHRRYTDAVDEKKALEALITSLRTHLTRLTTELASHQELLTSFRQLREADAQELRAHSAEILELREQVQRLAGEVEVLRGVVEEGLNERRASRDISRVEIPEEERSMSHGREEEDEEEDEEEEEDADEMEPIEEGDSQQETDDEEPEPFDPTSLDAERQRAADRTMRTDFATLGESTTTNAARERFLDDVELRDISVELQERRANMSTESIVPQSPRCSSPAPRGMRATVDDTQDVDDLRDLHTREHHSRSRTHPEPSTLRPSAPTPLHAARRAPSHTVTAQPELDAPLPQVRGTHIERLFFSAPEHNAQTCAVCFRGRDGAGTGRMSPIGWSSPRRKTQRLPNVAGTRERGDPHHSDEGYEGSEGERPGSSLERSKIELLLGGDMRQWRTAAQKYGVPPQTVVSRVVRELEDDFTHYKSIYVELADQYKIMDAASDVRRRNTLAKHLREVVDILEQKGDRIASLYDLLQFRDKSVVGSTCLEKGTAAGPSWAGAAVRTH